MPPRSALWLLALSCVACGREAAPSPYRTSQEDSDDERPGADAGATIPDPPREVLVELSKDEVYFDVNIGSHGGSSGEDALQLYRSVGSWSDGWALAGFKRGSAQAALRPTDSRVVYLNGGDLYELVPDLIAKSTSDFPPERINSDVRELDWTPEANDVRIETECRAKSLAIDPTSGAIVYGCAPDDPAASPIRCEGACTYHRTDGVPVDVPDAHDLVHLGLHGEMLLARFDRAAREFQSYVVVNDQGTARDVIGAELGLVQSGWRAIDGGFVAPYRRSTVRPVDLLYVWADGAHEFVEGPLISTRHRVLSQECGIEPGGDVICAANEANFEFVFATILRLRTDPLEVIDLFEGREQAQWGVTGVIVAP